MLHQQSAGAVVRVVLLVGEPVEMVPRHLVDFFPGVARLLQLPDGEADSADVAHVFGRSVDTTSPGEEAVVEAGATHVEAENSEQGSFARGEPCHPAPGVVL